MSKTLISIALTLILLFSGLTFLSVTKIITTRDYNQELKDVSYSFSKPIVEQISYENEVYNRLIVENAPNFGNPGEPLLPAKGCYILLPQHTKINEIKVTGEKVKVEGVFQIEPAEQPVSISKIDTSVLPKPDSYVYNSKDLYPGRLYDNIGVQYFRGFSILILRLYPVQYIPLTGELFYYPDLRISINTDEEEKIHPLFRGLKRDKQLVMQKVDNPGVINSYTNVREISDEADNYVIITKDEFKNEFEVLLNIHEEDGINSGVKTVEEIYYEYDGVDNAEKIRNYIIDGYKNSSLEYVLIAGDSHYYNSDIPVRNLSNFRSLSSTTWYRVEIPSDLYLACLDGSFNFDGDDYWGEYNDGVDGGHPDLFADVFVGRACIDNKIEIDNFIEKTYKYWVSNRNALYLKKVLLVGEHTSFLEEAKWGGNILDELVNSCNKHGYNTVGIPSNKYDISRLYDKHWPAPETKGWPVSYLINLINKNYHFINHVGHASKTTLMKLRSNSAMGNVGEINNYKPFFIHSVGCDAGWFNRMDIDSIAEYLTVKDSHGAYAGLFNTREGLGNLYTTDGPSPRLLREFWDAVYGEKINLISHAMFDAKEDNVWRIDVLNQNDTIRYVLYSLNYFGDPAISFHEPKIKNVPIYDKIPIFSKLLDHFPLLTRMRSLLGS